MKASAVMGLVVAVSAVIAGCAAMGGAPVKFSDGVLVNTAGMTLYTFDKDPAGAGKSVCNDKCAVAWPPLKAAADDRASGDFSVITRNDGSRQWAHKGKPLYLWVKDQKPGDRTGDGFNKVWRVVHQEYAPLPPSGY